MTIFTKDPDAILDFSVDWSTWLNEGETITASAWTVPTGLTLDSSTFDDTGATAWLSGGTHRRTYTVTNRITTSDGRTDDRSLTIRCWSR